MNTQFLIDVTHFKTHRKCSDGYNPKFYWNHKCPSTELPYINTEVCEQWNRALKRHRISCAFMSQTSFIYFLRILIARRNLRLHLLKDRINRSVIASDE